MARSELRRTNGGAATIDESSSFKLNAEVLEQLLVANLTANTKGGDGGTQLTADRDIAYHDLPSILVPRGMSMEDLEVIARKKAAELNKVHMFSRVFPYRPDDGGHAATVVIKRMFGITIGVDTKTMFGKQPPQYRTINISHNRTMEIPWGEMEVAALPGAVVQFGAAHDKSGPVFAISVKSPKKWADKIEAFFDAVSDELRHSSIYRGKALEADDAGNLKFFDPHAFNPARIVFSADVRRHLAAGVFGLIRHTDASRAANLSTKRCVLAHGPFGTGKTSLGRIAAVECVENGWTYIKVNAKDVDAIRDAFATAALYGPAVLFIEDIDRYTPKATDKDAMAELLDIFDGVGSKDMRLLVIMTTNHPEKIPAGMWRPGRLDYVLEISGLDRQGTEELIKANVPSQMLDENINYDQVYEQMRNWQPAWISGAAARATELAIARSGGDLGFQLDTVDLVAAAKSYSAQIDWMNKALEGTPVNKLDETLGDLVATAARQAVNGVKICDDDDGYERFVIKADTAA